MAKNLLFPDNSSMSNTDDARVSRLEATYPTSVAGRIQFSSAPVNIPGARAITASGLVAPTGIQATGSTFAFVVQGNFAFTSDGTSITIYWDGTNGSNLLAVRRADGSNFSVLGDSMTVSSLTNGVTYGFSSFVCLAQPNRLSFVQGDSGIHQFAFSPSANPELISAASRTQRLTTNERITEGLIFFTAAPGASGLGTGTYTGQSI